MIVFVSFVLSGSLYAGKLPKPKDAIEKTFFECMWRAPSFGRNDKESKELASIPFGTDFWQNIEECEKWEKNAREKEKKTKKR